MADNHVREERITCQIKVVAKEAEEGREKLKAKMKASETRVLAQM